jgi:hypothetical protein
VEPSGGELEEENGFRGKQPVFCMNDIVYAQTDRE